MQDPSRSSWEAAACAARTLQLADSMLAQPSQASSDASSPAQQPAQPLRPEAAGSPQLDVEAAEKRAKAKARKVNFWGTSGM